MSTVGLIGCQPGGKVIEPLPGPAMIPMLQQQQVDSPPSTTVMPTPMPTLPYGNRSLAGKTVMIDPGHGGKDSGTQGTRSPLSEKMLVLDISNRMARELQARGAKVYCTRDADVFLELDQRANAADQKKVDLFVSVHVDAIPSNPSASGTRIHIYTRPSPQSQSAAQLMVLALQRGGIECGGILRSNFHVIREHNRPAMLVECGFLTNTKDTQLLNTSAYRARLAVALADGVAAYLSK